MSNRKSDKEFAEEFAKKFNRLIKRDRISEKALNEIIEESEGSGRYPEELLLAKGICRHEVLFCLAEYYGLPFVEYDESVVVSQNIMRHMDMERLKSALWIPLSVTQEKAKVAAYTPDNPSVLEDIKKTLNVEKVDKGGSTFYRIQAGPLSNKTDAKALCTKLQAQKQDCIVAK